MYISFSFLFFSFFHFLVIVSLLQPHITQKYKKQNKEGLSSIEKWYVHNIFTIFLQQILSDRLLLVVIVETKK